VGRSGCYGVMLRTIVTLAWALAALSGASVEAADSDSDVVVISNGDRLTGQIKSVQQGLLTFDTDAAGTLSIEWTYVTSIVSASEFLVEVSGGERYTGTLGAPQHPGELEVIGAGGPKVLRISDVVEILPIGGKFWKRLNGSLNLGLSFTQNNQAIQYNLSAIARNRTRKGIGTFQANSLFNTQEDADSSSQHYLDLGVTRFRKKRRNVFGLTQLQSNPNQGYNLRWVVGGGVGKFLVERSDVLFNVSTGLVYDREYITGSADVDNTGEFLLSFDFGSFTYKQLSRVITLTLNTFTNVTDTPRFRAQLNFKLNWEIVNNFNLGISVLEGYDSRPPSADADYNDLSFVTSVGYSF